MTEKQLYPLFRNKLRERNLPNTSVFELKIVKSKRFALSSVHEHQIAGLLGALQGLVLRIADQPFVKGGYQQKKSFDMVWFNRADAFVVPVFYLPRKKKTAYLIPVKSFQEHVKSHVKSLKEDELKKFVSFEI